MNVSLHTNTLSKVRFGGVSTERPKTGTEGKDFAAVEVPVLKTGRTLKDIFKAGSQDTLTVYVDNVGTNDLKDWQAAGNNKVKQIPLKIRFAESVGRIAGLIDLSKLDLFAKPQTPPPPQLGKPGLFPYVQPVPPPQQELFIKNPPPEIPLPIFPPPIEKNILSDAPPLTNPPKGDNGDKGTEDSSS